ncbi:MAG: 30S ribosome-binding factor RbfA [Chloroflexi bacterium]|nr:30S ribosome-binding factor RbfA [Chloroflexota bacterium]
MSRRTDRLNELLREEISWLVSREMRDPRLSVLVTITRVAVSVDLRQAVVYVSVMGTAEEKQATLEMLRSAAGFLQHSLKPKLDVRHVPALLFKLDQSIEEGIRLTQILDTLGPSGEARP